MFSKQEQSLTREILFLPLEQKIHTFPPPCNILYICKLLVNCCYYSDRFSSDLEIISLTRTKPLKQYTLENSFQSQTKIVNSWKHKIPNLAIFLTISRPELVTGQPGIMESLNLRFFTESFLSLFQLCCHQRIDMNDILRKSKVNQEDRIRHS